MRQFVLPPSWVAPPDGRLVLGGKEARRLGSVLRLLPGDSFPGLAPDGRRVSCLVISAEPGRVELSVVAGDIPAGDGSFLPDLRSGRRFSESPQKGAAPSATETDIPRLVLAVGILKGSKLDDVVRAAAEAGVAAVIPLASKRAVPRGEFAGRLSRLRRVCAEALGQSGSTTRTTVLDPMGLHDFLDSFPASAGRLGLVFHETPLAQAPLHRYCTGKHKEAALCIGPEGGFADDELELFSDRGYVPAWLGPAVLRAETAAVFALASLRILFLERSSWITKKSDG
ncbi:MAG: RsmE family RNA methyltransferase [Spirochaetales bacterium]|nr:MAG: RsmE family RNA methyltransferase [Spirochaetales bacterium]